MRGQAGGEALGTGRCCGTALGAVVLTGVSQRLQCHSRSVLEVAETIAPPA